MAQTLNFSVDDTSPTISYSPFTDIFPPNLTAGWNSFFTNSGFPQSLGETGNGTSFHVTSHNQAALSIEWRGTGIQVLGFVQNTSYQITLDGVDSGISDPSHEILAGFQNLTDELHNLSITPVVSAGSNSVFGFDSAVIYYSSSSPLNLQSLDRQNLSFQGSWNLTNTQVYQSQTKGDVVQSTFSGASFLLNGFTSNTTGKYSVSLDNHMSTLNGRSTFTNPNTTLLFYATGLDPTVPHHVQVKNEDGSDLLLEVNGFQVGLPSGQPTSTPTPGSGVDNKGTIAALVLAGILGFLIITGFLYFFFVIRPQRRRKKSAHIAPLKKKEKDAGPLSILNITSTVFPDDMETGSQEGTLGHHKKQSSEKSGFARWKREAEGGFGSRGLLGITFRHSGSTGKKSGRSGASGGPSTKSSVFTLSSLFTFSSSRSSHGKGKKKAKSKQVSESSQSVRFALALPVRPDSADSFKEKDAGPSRFSADTSPSLSDMHTLSYMNTPSIRPVPAHALSSYHSNLHPAPKSVPRSSHGHSRTPSQISSSSSSVGLLLSHDNPQSDPHEEDIGQSYGPFLASMPSPFDTGRLSTVAPRDRGSARYSSDDGTSYYLGSAATRLAIRNLSPRTTQSSDTQPFYERIEQKARTSGKIPKQDDPAPVQPAPRAPLSPNSDTSFLYVVTPASKPVDIPPVKIPPAVISEVPQNVLLNISPSSPFRVDFPGNSLRNSNRGEPVTSHPLQEGSPEWRQDIRTPRSVFRLTPPSNPPSSDHGRNSFLDLGTSSGTSYQSQPDISSEHSTQKQQVGQSRWSTSTSQTTNLSRSSSSNVSVPAISPSSGPTSYFPYPVSLTPSPYYSEGRISSQLAQPHSTVLHIEGGQRDRRVAQVLRLSAFGSPTDSVPMSVTERRLRHSSSTGGSGGGANSSQLPPHPPLPSGHSNASSNASSPPF